MTLPSRREHPLTRDRVRAKLAEYSFLRLLLIFGGVLLLASMLLGVGYSITRQPGEGRSWLFWWRESFMVVTGVPLDAATAESDDAARQVVQALASTLGLLLPAIFLGGVLFKLLLSKDMFVFRSKIAITKNPAGHDRLLDTKGRHLAIRLYNATELELVELSCTVVSENERQSAAGTVTRLRKVPVANAKWPVAKKHVPRTIQVRLKPGDVRVVEDRLELVSINSIPIAEGDSLRVVVSGKVPELGTEFTQSHTFKLKEAISDEPFASIEPVDAKPAKDWSGWGCFEEGDPKAHCAYVFGYGSLVYEDKEELVGAPPRDPRRKYGHLRGFQRCWKVAMENTDPIHDHKHYVDPETAERLPIRVASLVVEPKPGSACNGVAIPVSAQQLARLDRREHYLARVDVTGAFDGKLDRPLFTYSATPGARAVYESGLRERNVFVSSGYVKRVRTGFEELLGPDAAAEYDASTPPPECPAKDLRLVRANGGDGI